MRTHASNQDKELIEHCTFKNVGDVCAEIAHLVESSNRWLSLDNINIAERYLANDFNLCFVLKPLPWFEDASLLKFGEWNAFVEPVHLLQVQDFNVVDLHETNGLNFSERPKRDKKHMSVFVSDSVDGPEKVVSSFVWFEPFYDGPRSGGEIIYLSLRTGRQELLSVTGKRKMGTLHVGGFESGGRGGQIVERRTEVVQAIARDQDKIVWDRFSEDELYKTFSRLRITVYPRSIRCVLEEGPLAPFECIDVLVGPLDF